MKEENDQGGYFNLPLRKVAVEDQWDGGMVVVQLTRGLVRVLVCKSDKPSRGLPRYLWVK